MVLYVLNAAFQWFMSQLLIHRCEPSHAFLYYEYVLQIANSRFEVNS